MSEFLRRVVPKSCSTHGEGLTSVFLITALEQQDQEPAQEPLAAVWTVQGHKMVTVRLDSHIS